MQITDIIVYNGDTPTPVANTFGYRTSSDNKVTWKNPGSTTDADKSIGIARSENKDNTRIACTLAVPIVNDVGSNGVVVNNVERVLRGRVEFVLPHGSTAAERRDLLAMLQGLIALDHVDSPITTMVVDLEGLT